MAANVGRLPAAIADVMAGRWWNGSLGTVPGLVLLTVLVLGLAPLPAWPPIERGTLAGASVLLLTALPSLLVFPKAVYLLPALLLGTLALARAANGLAGVAGWARSGAAGRPLLAAAAALGVAWCWAASPRPGPRPVLETVRLLRGAHAMQGRPPWRLLENDQGWCVYLGLDRCHAVQLDDLADAPLQPTLAAARPDAILVAATWLAHRTLAGDPQFRRFLQAPEEFGFRRAFSSGSGVFFVRTTNGPPDRTPESRLSR